MDPANIEFCETSSVELESSKIKYMCKTKFIGALSADASLKQVPLLKLLELRFVRPLTII
jgi:hypothetical protein